MCRLYLYTTLQITKILEVVHHPNPFDSIPGKDSANKKLNALLDKEPRWLKPKNEEDMFRRCEQLDRSPVRATIASTSYVRNQSYSAPPLYTQGNVTPIKYEGNPQSATLEVPPWQHSPLVQSSRIEQTPFEGIHQRSASDDVFGPSLTAKLARVSPAASTSTDHTTGSLHRLLEGYSEAYVRTVRRLIRQYTAPMSDRGSSASPRSDVYTNDQSWFNDVDAAHSYSHRPYPLPGDFLSMDIHLRRQHPCFPQSEEHQKRWCMCHLLIDAPHSVWVCADRLTDDTHQLVTYGPAIGHLGMRDQFGNTMLHALAARGPPSLLLQTLHNDSWGSMVNVRNTAGQTFLHVLGDMWFHQADMIEGLLGMVEALRDRHGFEALARDHYGRTFLHAWMASETLTPSSIESVHRHSSLTLSARDAFGVKPALNPTGMDLDLPALSGSPSADDPAAVRDSEYLQIARCALQEPALEDADGRNGLHCLAMASLSVQSFMNKASMTPTLQGRQRKRGKTADEMLDCSEERLQLRLSLAEGLLNAGVDPNHYDSYGNTPLMAFCAELPEDDDYKTGPAIIRALLERGANINARNRAGETALHVAVRCGRKLAVKTLIEEKANVHVRDAAGRGVLALADAKVRTCTDYSPVAYCHYEACRAHLSGKGFAVQEPTVLQEWGAGKGL
ncbi:Ankyrin repeat domain-containing protein-like protein [Emericellopsis cladophorae]|uniref:Ankyrin repeat domain-containing protein-like protein n=1 Tax=Emericellopsis cladophorae TaxID=2686198 RepID=A0A9P9XWE5_9HYPO|nr:Ankyrin repeat domain-containing protein-like protein [Emericellopsis cladophorae]KAI6778665.1 Ankyrin repeat domain-containing protein-like protein [Emericellopsis cladophorae]